MSVAYLPKNVAPVIDGIAIQDPGVRVQAPVVITGQVASGDSEAAGSSRLQRSDHHDYHDQV